MRSGEGTIPARRLIGIYCEPRHGKFTFAYAKLVYEAVDPRSGARRVEYGLATYEIVSANRRALSPVWIPIFQMFALAWGLILPILQAYEVEQ